MIAGSLVLDASAIVLGVLGALGALVLVGGRRPGLAPIAVRPGHRRNRGRP